MAFPDSSDRPPPWITVRSVTKRYGATAAVRDVSLDVHEGEILVLLGPSGCGKTTLLRLIAGLETADAGEIALAGVDLATVPVHERGFAMVFQDFALFPHRTVAGNIGFGLRMRGWARPAIDARVAEILELLGLAGFGGRAVYELSGGEQQRVALGRALAPLPRLLLLDEPLGSLDQALRERLMVDLRQILKAAVDSRDPAAPAGRRLTSIYVTHDQEEAFALADRIAVMNAGRIERIDGPVGLYRRPGTSFVARFLGMENLFAGRRVSASPALYRTSLGDLKVAGGEAAPDEATLLIRPEAGRLHSAGEHDPNIVSGRLVATSFRGRHQVAHLAVAPEAVLRLEFDSDLALPSAGEAVMLSLDPEEIILLE